VSQIHPFALVSSEAEIGQNVSIGPYSVVDSGVRIGQGCKIAARVSIKAGTTLGENNEVCEGAVLGGKPQHLRAGEHLGELLIGDGNTIREFVTIHRGLHPNSNTTVGSNNLLMVNAHVAHDCCIGNQTILANNVMLAGHVTVGDRAYLSGAVGVHQFCRIGQLAMVGGQGHISQDVPPFVTVDGHSSLIVGLNIIGLRRAGFSSTDIQQLKQAYRIIYRGGMTWSETLQSLAATFAEGPATQFFEFLSQGKRGHTQERRVPRSANVAFSVHQEELTDESPATPLRHAA
jgi:UDP-N-acetylglucosamine acyltransferase